MPWQTRLHLPPPYRASGKRELIQLGTTIKLYLKPLLSLQSQGWAASLGYHTGDIREV